MSNSLRQHRIFIVDDEEVIASTLAMILQRFGFDAVPFTRPLKALEASRSEAPDLLVSDVMMPELNGIELAIRMRQVCPSCKVLLFSGQAGTQMLLDNARAHGEHFEYVGKPVHPTDLLRRIREGLGISEEG